MFNKNYLGHNFILCKNCHMTYRCSRCESLIQDDSDDGTLKYTLLVDINRKNFSTQEILTCDEYIIKSIIE